MKKFTIYLVTVSFIYLTGCTTYITKQEFAPKMYTEHPISILVLPPVNKTTAVDAKEYYVTTVAPPLTNSGYYVFPMEVVYDILQQEGLSETETMLNVPVQKFKEFFGADAVLYVTLLKWDTQYLITSGSVTVQAACELKSTTTGEVIWFYDGVVSVSTEGTSAGMGGWAGLLAKVVTTAINTATQDYVPLATLANEKIFLAMPFGKYNKSYNLDQKTQVEVKKSKNQNH
jgi:hypothetical protein